MVLEDGNLKIMALMSWLLVKASVHDRVDDQIVCVKTKQNR